MIPSLFPVVLVAAVAGVATVGIADWLDGHMALLLDEGWAAALASPRRRPVPPGRRWLAAGLAAGLAVATVLPVASAETAWVPLTLEGGLAICAWIDWRHRIIPDVVTLPLTVAGLLLALSSRSLAGGWPPAVAGALLGLALGTAVRWRGRLGWGDVKLLGAIGAWVGPLMVCLLFLTCCLAMVPLFLRRRPVGGGRFLPMAPMLALVTVPAVLALAAQGINADSLYLMNKITGSICWPCYSDDANNISIKLESK